MPFSPEFSFGEELTRTLSRHVDLGDLDIRINDADEPIYRPHRDSFSFDGKQCVNFDSLDLIEVPDMDGNSTLKRFGPGPRISIRASGI